MDGNRVNVKELDIIETEKDKMHLVIQPCVIDNRGPLLDKWVYEMILLIHKGLYELQILEERNDLKECIIKLGQFFLIDYKKLHQPHGKYSVLKVHIP